MASILPGERIERSILLIRGHKVMLDADLAELYGVETRALLQGCKPESKTIPGRFYVPDVKRGIRTFEITNCDLKERSRMAEKVKVWFDPEGDFLEVRFSDAPGFMRETAHNAWSTLRMTLGRGDHNEMSYL